MSRLTMALSSRPARLAAGALLVGSLAMFGQLIGNVNPLSLAIFGTGLIAWMARAWPRLRSLPASVLGALAATFCALLISGTPNAWLGPLLILAAGAAGFVVDLTVPRRDPREVQLGRLSGASRS